MCFQSNILAQFIFVIYGKQIMKRIEINNISTCFIILNKPRPLHVTISRLKSVPIAAASASTTTTAASTTSAAAAAILVQMSRRNRRTARPKHRRRLHAARLQHSLGAERTRQRHTAGHRRLSGGSDKVGGDGRCWFHCWGAVVWVCVRADGGESLYRGVGVSAC